MAEMQLVILEWIDRRDPDVPRAANEKSNQITGFVDLRSGSSGLKVLPPLEC